MSENTLTAAKLRLANLEIDKKLLEIEDLQRSMEMRKSQPIPNGSFHLVGEIHESSVHTLIASIEGYHRRVPGGAIEITINSGGGNVLDGFALVDFLKRLRKQGVKVTGIGTGFIASMASVILCACEHAVLTPHCSVMLHEISSSLRGSFTNQEDQLKFTKSLQDALVEVYCERSTLTPRQLKAMWQRKDVYLDAKTALKLGLVDEIEEF